MKLLPTPRLRRTSRGKWVFGVAFVALAALGACAAGCASSATFEGVSREAVAREAGLDPKEDGWSVDSRWPAINVYFEHHISVHQAWSDRIRVETRWGRENMFFSLSRKRLLEQERIELAVIIERILRKTQGRLVGCSLPELQNIRPVPVRVREHDVDVILKGVDRATALSVLRTGLDEIALCIGRYGGYRKDTEYGLAIHFYQQNTVSTQLVRHFLAAREVPQGLRLRIAALMMKGGPEPERLLPGKNGVWLARVIAVYILAKVPQARPVAPEGAAPAADALKKIQPAPAHRAGDTKGGRIDYGSNR